MISYVIRLLWLFRGYLIIIGAFALCFWVGWMCGLFGERKKKRKLPATARHGNLISRLSEMLMLACVAAVFITLMIWPRFERFDWWRISPDVAKAHTHFVIGLGCFALIGIAVGVLWRSLGGFITVIAACIIGFFYMVRLVDPVRPFGIQTAAARSVVYTITVNGNQGPGSLEGVDVWVNDVHLGKTPIRTTLNRFLETVPYRSSRPDGVDDVISVHRRNYRSYSGWGTSEKHRLRSFTIPEMPRDDEFTYDLEKGPSAVWDAIRERAKTTTKHRTYYARFELGGHAGYGNSHGTGPGSGGGASGGIISYSRNVNFELVFPSRRESIEKLLDVARMNDYQVNGQWCAAMEAYGKQGWEALRNAAYLDWMNTSKEHYLSSVEPAPTEKGLLKVMDYYASWRYGLDNVDDAKAAWKAFERLCRSVDRADYYSSDSIEGHALGLLIDKIDRERLVKAAVKRVRKESFRMIGFYSHFKWGKGIFQSPRDPDDRHGPASDYLVCDAVWRLDRHLDKIDDSSPNIVERRVSKAIVACHSPHGYKAMLLACRIGGPDLIPYFKECRAAYLYGDERFRIGYSTSTLNDVDMWLNLMINVSGPEGRIFRTENKNDFEQILEDIVGGREGGGAIGFGHLDFLSDDVSLGKECPAAKFWPKYSRIVKESKEDYHNYKLLRLWQYLVRLEPVMGVDDYLESWRSTVDRQGDFRYALHLLDMVEARKRKVIAQALKQELELRPENILQRNKDEIDTNEIRYLQHVLDRIIAEINEVDFAAYVIEDLKKYKSGLNIIEWLIEQRSGHIVAEIMAKSDEDQLRQKAIILLKNHPTPERVEILKRLAVDSDDDVKLYAKEALAELEEINVEASQ